MRKWIVYKHTSPSGKVYVGITCQKPERRWKGGTGYLRKDNHQPLFANAISKYGWNSFKHEIVLSDISKSEADYAEKYLIRWYKIHGLSYNITDGGDGGLGHKHSEETKKLISNLHKGMKYPKEASEKREKTKIENRRYYVLAVKPGVILQFNSNKEAAEALGIKNSIISTNTYRINTAKYGDIFDTEL